jgi:hypothetical protein
MVIFLIIENRFWIRGHNWWKFLSMLSRKIAFLLNSQNWYVFTKIPVCLVVTLCVSLTKLLVTRDDIENGNWSCRHYFVVTSPGIKVCGNTSVATYCSRSLINPNDPLVAVVSIDLMWMVGSGEVSDLSWPIFPFLCFVLLKFTFDPIFLTCAGHFMPQHFCVIFCFFPVFRFPHRFAF